ncbi:hypothetical protein [Jannaschia rubra]|uniref:Uncharacterized protein n=1 Tax=Jannaschia rubra TaxID=282197 RepID=A0A0M6XQA4_9RHOB|nr:hypothetical protein [Jannaschia rubra]CTQ32383.1 hypothetical protein JAN5088_01148 [Jannaschia rubra]SFG45683.1 hypothetical protein SAMN04488517_10556 [Jannaschia rubra]
MTGLHLFRSTSHARDGERLVFALLALTFLAAVTPVDRVLPIGPAVAADAPLQKATTTSCIPPLSAQTAAFCGLPVRQETGRAADRMARMFLP